jgi:23S rRNA (uridine2552-2'-O)-methyltransferase
MAPNMSGNRAMDMPRAMYLAELALDMATKVLEPNGRFLVKVFQGEGIEEFRRSLHETFDKVVTRKPAASRSRSSEVYLLGSGLKMV